MRRAFTLIELLVVIAILMVLSAILLSSLVQARNQARSTQCLSNVRQISQACLIYTEQYQALPRGGSGIWGHWMSLVGLQDENKVHLRCPSFGPSKEDSVRVEHESGYAVNNCLLGHNLSLAAAPDVSKTIMIADVTLVMCPRGGDSWDPMTGQYAIMPDCLQYPESKLKRKGCRLSAPYGCSRHNGGANYALLDGSAKWLKPTRFRIWMGEDTCLPNSKPGNWVGPSNGFVFAFEK